jgi:hypothetical protein
MRVKEYHEWVKAVTAESEQFQIIQRTMKELSASGGCILHFSHHDLDGVASAAIIKMGLEELGVQVYSRLPTGFQIYKSDLLQGLEEYGPVDAVLVTDRGSDEDFDALTQLHGKIILLDHHPSRNPSKKCLLYNPSLADGNQTAASHLCHMLITSLGVSSIYLDFYALLGCRGDFTFDPVTGERENFVKVFMEYAEEILPNLFQAFEGRPTRYDLVFRDRTTRINQLAEVLNAACFAHTYSGRSPKLSGIYGPTLCFQILRRAVEERWALQELSFTDAREWFQSFPEGEILSEVYRLYLEDWERAMRWVEKLVKIGTAGGTAIYFVMGRDAPLMPLAASVKIHELKESIGEDILILVLHEGSAGVNISARETDQKIHCGFLLNTLAKRIAKSYGLSESVSGGGHARAGECIISTPKIKSEKIMEELMRLIQDITLIDQLYEKGILPKSGFERAEELGLRYIRS